MATTPTGEFRKFAQFQKLEDSADGMPTVWGVSTWEKPDSDSEICDYETAVPVYQAWSGKALKRTTKAGQEPSLGNVRIQHGSDVGGKVTKITFDDGAKEIWLGSEPKDDQIRKELKEGFYTGYSQGGSYAWRACDKCETPLPLSQGQNYCPNCDGYVTVRYGLKRLAEVSYVDSPAIGEGFEHVKANGSREILKFQHKEPSVNKDKKTKRVAGVNLPSHCFAYVGDPEKTETWKLPIEFPGDEEKTKRHIRNALARFSQTQGIPDDEKPKVKAKIEAAARSHGIDVDGEKSAGERRAKVFKDAVTAALKEAKIEDSVIKGLYQVSRFASILEDMAYLWSSAVYETEIEGDDSEVPADLKDLLDSMVESFLAMATEEARELSARKTTTPTGDKTMKTQEELEKDRLELEKAAKKSLATHFAKAASHHEKMADHHEKMAGHHEDMHEAHKAAHAGCEECMGKTDGADHPSAAVKPVLENQQEFHKAMMGIHKAKGATHTKMAKAHDAHAEHLHKMAEHHDEESAKAVWAEIKKFDDEHPEPAAAKTEPAKAATMDDEIKKAAEAVRGSQEYKDAVAAIAKAQVEAEVAALRDKTLAPLGIKVGDTIKGLKIVPRDTPEEFAFATASPVSNTAGL